MEVTKDYIIKRPDYITQDAIDDERLVYYRTYQRSPHHWMIKVVVGENEVITSYRVIRLKRGESVLDRLTMDTFKNAIFGFSLWNIFKKVAFFVVCHLPNQYKNGENQLYGDDSNS